MVSLVTAVRLELPRIGARKLQHLLEAPLRDLGVGRDKLLLILRANNMLIKPLRSYHTTTNSKHMFKKHKNLIEDIVPSRPEQIWVSDITYIGSRNNHRYLALITDAYSKKIVGYNLSDSLEANSCIKALKMAVKDRKYKEKELIHHSDRGIQYCCNAYQEQLIKHNLICSMTESYDPCANAVAERVNGILKQEFMLEQYSLNAPMLEQLVKQSIRKYNEMRPHLSCRLLTPNQMHRQDKIAIRTYKKVTVHKGTLVDC